MGRRRRASAALPDVPPPGSSGGLLGALRGSMGSSAGAMSGVVGVLEDLYAPGAARARELMDAEHQVAIPVPSPGDRLLTSGKLVIRTRPKPAEADPAN